MLRIETTVLIGLCALLAPLIIALALHWRVDGRRHQDTSEMPNRAQFSARIVCINQRCGQEADVEWAENEDPTHSLDRDLIRISEGFSCKKRDLRRDPDLVCDTCRTVAYLSQSNRDIPPSFAFATPAAARARKSATRPPSPRHRRILSNTPVYPVRARF
jgi:hypothetical protein